MADRFSCLVIALATLVLWGSVGSADFKTRDDIHLHILSYQDMLKLPVGSRASYIRSLRTFMIREEQKYPKDWNAAKKSAGLSIPSIDLMWSKAVADDATSDDADARAAQHVQQYWEDQKTRIFGASGVFNPTDSTTLPMGSPSPTQDDTAVTDPDAAANGAAPAEAASDTAANDDAAPNGMLPELVVNGIKQTENKSCQMEATCYFAGNRTSRSANCICSASRLEDKEAKEDTRACGSGKIACNRMLFGTNNDGDAFCAPRSNNATAWCDENAQTPEQVAANFAKIHSGEWDVQRKLVSQYCNVHQNADCVVLMKRLNTTVAQAPQGPHTHVFCQMFVNGLNPAKPSDGAEVFVVGSSNDPSVENSGPGANNLGKYTSFNFKMKPATDDLSRKCETGRPKDPGCYGDGDYPDIPGVRILGSDPETNTISMNTIPGFGNKIKVDPETGKCSPAKDEPKPIAVQANTTGCGSGTIFCSVQQITQQCTAAGQRHFVVSVDGKGKVSLNHPTHDLDGGKNKTSNKNPTDTTYPGTMASDRDLENVARNEGKDFADVQNWAKESAREHKGDVAEKSTDIRDPNDIKVYLGNNDEFVHTVMSSPAMDQKFCPSNQWVAIGKPVNGWHGVVGTWSGADETLFIACADLKLKAAPDKKSMVETADKLKNRAYIKVHMDHNSGKVIAVETGTMSRDGRPASAEVFRPGEKQPYLTIEPSFVAAHPFSKSYKVTENVCPDQGIGNPYPYTMIVKTTSGGRSSYMACHAKVNVRNAYYPWPMMLSSPDSNGVIGGHSDDSQDGSNYADFKFSVNEDLHNTPPMPPTCKVQKRDQGATSFYDAQNIYPLDPNLTGQVRVPGTDAAGTH